MYQLLYTYRVFLSIPVAIFAGRAVFSLHEGHLLAGIVVGSIALLALALLLIVIYKNDGTVFNKTTLNIMFSTILCACFYIVILYLLQAY